MVAGQEAILVLKAMGSRMRLLQQPTGTRLGDWLNANLGANWAVFRGAVAFVKWSGVKHIATMLADFAQTHPVELIVGVDHMGTSYEGLKGLMDAMSPNGRLLVFHNRLFHTFHPKVYLFRSEDRAEVVVGSGNLTEGGLYTNYEVSIQVVLDLRVEADVDALARVEGVLDRWADVTRGTSVELDESRLDSLVRDGLVPKEAEMRVTTPEDGLQSEGLPFLPGVKEVPFDAVPVPAAPAIPSQATPTVGQNATHRRFVMTLQKTDVGVGQTTAGTSKRSPEIFVPLKARNADPGFWDWQSGFEEDPERAGKFDRRGVRMRISNEVVEEVNMMTWPPKHDFRLRSEALRSLGSIGDILVMEKVDADAFEYDVGVASAGTGEHEEMLARCTQSVRNSKKRFGYF